MITFRQKNFFLQALGSTGLGNVLTGGMIFQGVGQAREAREQSEAHLPGRLQYSLKGSLYHYNRRAPYRPSGQYRFLHQYQHRGDLHGNLYHSSQLFPYNSKYNLRYSLKKLCLRSGRAT